MLRPVAYSALNRARIAGIEGGLQVTALEYNVPVVGLAVVHSVALVRGARPLDEGVFPHVEIFECEVPLGRQDLGRFHFCAVCMCRDVAADVEQFERQW